MKRIKATLLADEACTKAELLKLPGLHEIESFEEKELPKDASVLKEYSFDALLEGALEFANGIWLMVKGFVKMSSFAVVMIVEGLKWLWKGGVGKAMAKSKEKKKEGK